MKKIDDPLQNDFGTLSQNIGLNQLSLTWLLLFRLISFLQVSESDAASDELMEI